MSTQTTFAFIGVTQNKHHSRALLLGSSRISKSAVIIKLTLIFILLLIEVTGFSQGKSLFLVNVNEEGVLLEGYDPVGYFTANKPIKGTTDYQTRYHGATYLFASAENKKLFDENPATYEPQYGGYCAYAVSVGKLRPIDIHIFQFVDGRLLFQHTQQAYDLFNKDTEGNTQKADEKWPGLVKKHAGKPVKYNKPAK